MQQRLTCADLGREERKERDGDDVVNIPMNPLPVYSEEGLAFGGISSLLVYTVQHVQHVVL